jgi:SAM-dependent methyltransferase
MAHRHSGFPRRPLRPRFPPMPARDQFPRRDITPRHLRAGARPAPGGTRTAAGLARAAPTAWESQAKWYDEVVGDDGDDFYRRLILPTVLKRIDGQPGELVLDVACGQGVLGRVLAKTGMRTLGVDASPSLIAAAKTRAGGTERHVVGDVRILHAAIGDEMVDHAAAVLSLQDLDPIAPVFAGLSHRVKAGGRLVIVLTHPGFRIPKRSTWGWDEAECIRYRRLDGYLLPFAVPIFTHPGRPEDPSRTMSFHRPIGTYLNAMGEAGFAVTGADELCSHRRGTLGQRSAAEDLAAREFPLFLVLTAVRLPGPALKADPRSFAANAGPASAPKPTGKAIVPPAAVVSEAAGPVKPAAPVKPEVLRGPAPQMLDRDAAPPRKPPVRRPAPVAEPLVEPGLAKDLGVDPADPFAEDEAPPRRASPVRAVPRHHDGPRREVAPQRDADAAPPVKPKRSFARGPDTPPTKAPPRQP